MSFATEIKALAHFAKQKNFVALTDNDNSHRSWVRPLDDEHLVYLYIYAYQKKGYASVLFNHLSPTI